MGVRVALFAVGFNALFWLSRATLAPWLAARAGGWAGFAAALVAPLALLWLAARVAPARRDALVGVAACSLGLAQLVAG